MAVASAPLCYTDLVTMRSRPGAELVVDLRGVVKSFGRTPALRGLDLAVRAGEIHSFLGPNGSGKTTTLRLMLGLLRADGGMMNVLGSDPWADAAQLHRKIAYVPGDVSLWPNLTGGEVIDMLGRLHRSGDERRRAELVERFGLDTTKKARAYSKGNRQKVALIAALASDAELFLLDEPTTGLDPIMEATFRECVGQLRDEGKSVLLSSHILSEAEALSDRVSIVREGVVVETGSLDQLRHLTATEVSARTSAVPTELDQIAGVHDLRVEDGHVTARVERRAMPEFMQQLAAAGVESLTSQPPTLEELFLRHYQAAARP